MKHSKIVTLLVTAVPLILSSAEPSAFGAGNLDNPTPYGLTSAEKIILQNKDKLHKVVVSSNNQANEVDSLRERIDGLQSIIENLSRKSHNNKIDITKLENKNSENIQNSDEYAKRLSNVVQSNSENIAKTEKLTAEISLLLEKINRNYVKKSEFNALVRDVNKFKGLIAKELNHGVTSKKTTSKETSADIYDRAKAMFDKRYYTKAITDYELLISKNYKPAYAHYMIGEMNYKRKKYADAITYFKKSSSLYSKAVYMPNLMLHTAISMDRTGDKQHAQAFYKAINAKYPDSKEALIAVKKLGL